MQERFGGSDGKQVMMTLNQALAYFPHACAEALLKAASQLAVLDEERRSDQVRFFHQLLQEYFAARQLATQPAPVAELARSEWRPDCIRPSLADKLAALQDFEPLPSSRPDGMGRHRHRRGARTDPRRAAARPPRAPPNRFQSIRARASGSR